MVGNDVGEDMPAETLGMRVFLLTDCLINKDGADVSRWPHGSFDVLKRSLADETEYQMKLAGFTPRQIEGKATGWILLDYHDVVVHVFMKDQREFYSLEKLWADAEEVDVNEFL